ncbi:MAG: hypothetical protein D3910_08485 [Candidatus Electrothrix sp. ATG2]|nr:hypothetical protein [Candidatus Electrothrix sp. ATG2]
MTNTICKKCISYTQQNSELDLIQFALDNQVQLGDKISEVNGDSLYFAPAGTYPPDPVVTVCGLATSFTALQDMKNTLEEQDDMKKACLQSVYKGGMAVNLALLLKALGVEKLIDEKVLITINDQTKDLAEMNLNDFGKSGFFEAIPDQVQFTQAMCCWDENGKSQYKREWWKYSEACRSTGYLSNLAQRFIRSSRSRLLLLLGGSQNQNMKIITQAVKERGTEDVVVVDNKAYQRGMDVGEAKKKYVVNVHHPANTKHIYNNRKNFSSILYSFYEQGNWDFPVEKYGNIGKETMEKNREFYRYLQRAIDAVRQ